MSFSRRYRVLFLGFRWVAQTSVNWIRCCFGGNLLTSTVVQECREVTIVPKAQVLKSVGNHSIYLYVSMRSRWIPTPCTWYT